MSLGAQKIFIAFFVTVFVTVGLFLTTVKLKSEFPQTSFGSIDQIGNLPPDINPQAESADSMVSTTTNISKILFTGDIMLARHVEHLMNSNGASYPFLGQIFADHKDYYAVGNFEAAAPLIHKKTPNYNFQFSVAKENLPSLRDFGFSHVSLANNHSLDFGEEGYLQTVKSLSEFDINAFGHQTRLSSSSIIFIDLAEFKVAVLAVNTVTPNFIEADLLSLVKEAKQNSDLQIVYIHWGDEYQHLPTNFQSKLALKLADLQVSAIIGHHPHVVQSIDKIGNTLVFYSLGNFIFDQYFSEAVQQSYYLAMNIRANELVFDIIPVSSTKTKAQPQLMSPSEASFFLEVIASYSRSELSHDIQSGTIRTVLSLASLE